MLTRIRARLNYANVVATLALFVALGSGSSYAVSKISGSQIRDNSIAGKKLKRNTIGGKRIEESTLGTVPNARNAGSVGGLTAQQLLLRCPQGTLAAADVCVETQPRSPEIYSGAVPPAARRTARRRRAGGCRPTASFSVPSSFSRSRSRRAAS